MASVRNGIIIIIYIWTVSRVIPTDNPTPCNVTVPCSCCLRNNDCIAAIGRCISGLCKDGYWGLNCIQTCPPECVSCNRNFNKTRMCNECVQGYYGQSCSKNCSKACEGNVCFKDTGNCNSCTTGHFGHTCTQPCSDNCKTSCNIKSGKCKECINGYYEVNCTLPCPTNCNNSMCDRSSGNCSNGCIMNFGGDKCSMCNSGFYGRDCDKQCSSNCVDKICQRDNGSCAFGCQTGYSDSQFCCLNNSFCEDCSSDTQCRTCVHGKYGDVCNLNCSENCNGACDKKTGFCFKCNINRYGKVCENTCSEHCNTSRCDRYNGSCLFGCEDKYFGDSCDKICSFNCSDTCDRNTGACNRCIGNRFGRFCEQDCPVKCHQHQDHVVSCQRDNGTCNFGCEQQYYGDKCENACSQTCNWTCDQKTGHCFSCALHQFGLHCEHNCSESCLQGNEGSSSCHEKNGTCSFGCQKGYYGDRCVMEGIHDDSSFTLILAVSSGAGVAALVAVAITVVVARKRCTERKRKSPVYDESANSGITALEHVYQNTSFKDTKLLESAEEEAAGVPTSTSTELNDYQNNPYYSNAKRPVTRMRKSNPRQFLRKSDDNYKDEFELLPNGLFKPTTEAKRSGNARKNRYNMIYPYDDSRVKVAGSDSDYINASYIDGYRKKNEYIAAQGPTKKHLGKEFKMFWEMVWQEKVETIVMVTKLREVTGMKCDQYWPNMGSSSTYAGFLLRCVHEEMFAEFTVRSLTITKGNAERHINHVHFTAWPDKGVPNDVISIINLRHKVVKMRKMFDGPLLVHCSAGIGRTGTYIALDILTCQGSVEDHVDVFDCVLNMRHQRVNMVQTQEQYKFLHHAVLWTLTSDIKPLSSDRFEDLSWLDDNKLTEIFDQLNLKNFYDNDVEKKAINENKSVPFTNRQGSDIPGHRHTVSLAVNELSRSSSYINAVYLDSYKKQNRFIAAMTPLPDTVTQFLNMLIQEGVTCIVDLTPSDCPQDDVGDYLPAGYQDLEYESHVFRVSNREIHGCFVKREIALFGEDKLEGSKVRTIHHYQFTKWSMPSALPISAEDFVTLVNEVHTITTDATGPVVIHCLTGAERSGLFCAVWLLIERMTADREVSVINTLRQVKTRRRMAIPNKEQIAFCFECVSAHLMFLEQRVYTNTAAITV